MAELLAYLVRHPDAGGLAFARPWWLLLLPAAALLARPWRDGDRSRWLRAATLGMLVAAAAGLSLTASVPEHGTTVIVAVDVSASMSGPRQEWARRAMQRIARALAPDDRLGVVAFAGGAVVAVPPGKPAPAMSAPRQPARGATDLRAALQLAGALVPGAGAGRVVLLSDGNQNRNDARTVLPELRARGIPVDVWLPPAGRSPGGDVQLERVVVEPVVNAARVFPLRVVLRNPGPPRPVMLRLHVDGSEVDSAPAELETGLNAFEIPYVLGGTGAHVLRAVAEAADDPEPRNNVWESPITALRPMRVLLATNQGWHPLQSVLDRHGAEVVMAPFAAAPREAGDLDRFQAVILDGPAAGDLPAGFLRALESYVGRGGALILIGGARTFGDPGLRDSPLARLSPVTFEPRRPHPGHREPLALFLLIDRSNSMGYNSRRPAVRDGEKLRYAKEAALAVVRQLKEHDLVGVIAFDSQPWEVSSLKTVREARPELERLIPRLAENGGTDFLDALDSARRQLVASRVTRRHIILLTDGDTNRGAADHYPLIERLAEERISVTTIRIGSNDVNLQLLRDISGRTGGQFHHVVDVTLLPELMLRDTTRALGAPRAGERRFLPAVARELSLLEGIAESDLPPLRDFAYTRPRPGAEVVLDVARGERRDPLLAVWQWGLGRVVAFAADLGGGAEPWLAWREFGRFWSQTVHWAAGHAAPADHALQVERTPDGVRLVARMFGLTAQPEAVAARVHLPGGDAVDVPLYPTGRGTFAGESTRLPPGHAEVVLVTRLPGGRVREQRMPLFVPENTAAARDEWRRLRPDVGLLREIAERTGGRLDGPPLAPLEARERTRTEAALLDPVLLPLAMFLFVAEIAARMLRRGRRGVSVAPR